MFAPINFCPDLKARATNAYNPETPAAKPAPAPVAPRVAFGKRKVSK